MSNTHASETRALLEERLQTIRAAVSQIETLAGNCQVAEELNSEAYNAQAIAFSADSTIAIIRGLKHIELDTLGEIAQLDYGKN